MSLAQKYEDHFPADLEQQTLVDYPVGSWPTGRYQAITAFAGQGDTVLDIGCGGGDLLYQLRSRFKTLMGIEYSSRRLLQAQANLRGLPFVGHQGSAEDMSMIATASVDRIVSADVVEHIPDIYAAVAEMHRVLKPDGWMVINTPNVAFIKKRLLLLLGRFPSTSQPNEGIGEDILHDGGHLHYFTYRSLTLVLERHGFRVDKRVGFGPMRRVHDLYPQLLSVAVQVIARKA